MEHSLKVEANMQHILKAEANFRRQMLDRFWSDCKYYLGNGNRVAIQLWALDEKKHIQNMKTLYESFEEGEKPEWITMEQILEYEREMIK